MAKHVSVRNDQIETTICDYGIAGHPGIATANYEELMSGSFLLNGKQIKTAPLSSYRKARILAEELKQKVIDGIFPLSPPVQALPEHSTVKGLTIRAQNEGNK
jgi:uncharacterized protein (DUF39 family)